VTIPYIIYDAQGHITGGGTHNHTITGFTTESDVNTLIGAAIGGISSFNVEVVSSLPTTDIDTHTIYFLSNSGTGTDIYDEYMYINNAWEKIGSTQVDLSGYVPTSRKINNKTLTADITLTASDVGALSNTSAAASITATDISNWNAKSDFSGSYNDLTNTPTIPVASTITPVMDGTATIGADTGWARGNHVHPVDTSRQAKITASGILKGDGSGGVTAATAGTDYQTAGNYMVRGVDYVTAGNVSGSSIGISATVEGANNKAEGNYSHAEGVGTKANGSGSHAEGYTTTADGQCSHTEGIGTIAKAEAQHVFGAYNTPDEHTDANERGDYIEIVGNGSNNSERSNARTLDWNGNEVLAGKLTLGASPTVTMEAATKGYVDSVTSLSTKVSAYTATLATSSWSNATPSTYTYSNASITCGKDGTVPPIIACTSGQNAYSTISSAVATSGTGIVFTAPSSPTIAIDLVIIDYS